MNSNYTVLTFKQIRNILASNNKCCVCVSNNDCPLCAEMYYEPEFDCDNITIILTGRPCDRVIEYMTNNPNVCMTFTNNNGGRQQVVTAMGTACVQEDSCANACCGNVTVFVKINKITGKQYCRAC